MGKMEKKIRNSAMIRRVIMLNRFWNFFDVRKVS
jgi:hypothetical protein